MKSIILKGGLGNQLFQISKFYDLYKNNKDLKLDIRTGFFLDFKYKRKLEIKALRKSKFINSFPFSFISGVVIFLDKYFPYINNFLRIKVIDDSNKNKNIPNSNLVIFNGYFQDYKLINSNLKNLYNLVKPNFKIDKKSKFQELTERINSCTNSVALCIRFYEESKDPKIHASKNSKIKSPEAFNKVIRHFELLVEEPNFFVFVQKENQFTDNLKFNSPFYIVSHDNDYIGSWERLTAQAHCKHHIFNNSTFYYWGAIFSRFLNKRLDIYPHIFVTDNFIFENAYCPEWKKF